jgi:hypothetical protein
LTIPSYDSNWSKQNGFLISGRGSFRSITVKSNNRILYSASPIEIEDWFAIQGGDGNFFYLYSIVSSMMYIGYSEIYHLAELNVTVGEKKNTPYTLTYNVNGLINSVKFYPEYYSIYANSFEDKPVFIDKEPPLVFLNSPEYVSEKFKKYFVKSIKIFDNQNTMLFDGSQDTLSYYHPDFPTGNPYPTGSNSVEDIEIKHRIGITIK